MQKRRLAAVLLGFGVLAGILVLRFARTSHSIYAATSTLQPAESYLVILGVGDSAATNWDGSITVSGAAIEILRGWRFTNADSISGTSSWKVSTRTTPSLNPPGPVQENGLIVKVSASSNPIT